MIIISSSVRVYYYYLLSGWDFIVIMLGNAFVNIQYKREESDIQLAGIHERFVQGLEMISSFLESYSSKRPQNYSGLITKSLRLKSEHKSQTTSKAWLKMKSSISAKSCFSVKDILQTWAKIRMLIYASPGKFSKHHWASHLCDWQLDHGWDILHNHFTLLGLCPLMTMGTWYIVTWFHVVM